MTELDTHLEQVGGLKSARRGLFRLGAAGALAAGFGRAARAESGLPAQDWGSGIGAAVADVTYGMPPKDESDMQRRLVPWLTGDQTSSISFTPLQYQTGIITPSGVFFERYHNGMVQANKRDTRLMIHGLVDRPLIFTFEDILRMPSETHVHFLECAANGGMEWRGAQLNSLQYTHGMVACAEWVGVKLSTLLEQTGLKKEGKWLLAEGSDGSHLTRSIPIEKALDDCMVVYGQNGESLRHEQGYPIRLIVPGWQGNMNVKWLRRLKIGDKPWFTHEETSKYTELRADGKAYGFTWPIYAKSVITFPCPEMHVKGPGVYEVRGFAWSGLGKIKQVDVSFDGGVNYTRARLDGPVQPKCFTRFTCEWRWDGKPALLQSRAIDETGFVQPTIAELRAMRGSNGVYNNNSIQTWEVKADGSVNNVQLA